MHCDSCSTCRDDVAGPQRKRRYARQITNPHGLRICNGPGNADLLQQLNRGGMTVVLVTHEHDIATFASRIISFRDGHVVKDEQVAQPADAQAMLRELEKEAA